MNNHRRNTSRDHDGRRPNTSSSPDRSDRDRYDRDRGYSRNDNEYGVDSRAYGNGRNRTDNGPGEYDYRNEGYDGRNASDFENDRYSDAYYYRPSDHPYNYTDNYNDYDRDYDRNYSKNNGQRSSGNSSRRNDYFEGNDNRNYYGSYPSYGQSSPYSRDDNSHRDEERYRNYDAANRRQGSQYSNEGYNTYVGNIGREPMYDNNRYNDRDRDWEDRRRPNIRDRY